jgi:hypothetical protein
MHLLVVRVGFIRSGCEVDALAKPTPPEVGPRFVQKESSTDDITHATVCVIA